MAVIAEKSAIELQKMFKVNGEKITARYTVIYMEGKHELYDSSLNEVVFRGNKKEMEIFIQGFICGRTTLG
jgi:hypothetical protein